MAQDPDKILDVKIRSQKILSFLGEKLENKESILDEKGCYGSKRKLYFNSEAC